MAVLVSVAAVAAAMGEQEEQLVDYSKYTFNECAEAYQDCLASECCMTEGYACFKKPHVHYAQCRKLGNANCVDSPDWRCPGWAECPEDYEACYDAKCCKGHKVGCFKRPTRQYAQCRHYPGSKDACVSTEDWLCPGTWETCAPTMGSCQKERCCDHVDHECYAKHDTYAQCLPKGTCAGKTDSAGTPWSCEVLRPLPPASPTEGGGGGGGGAWMAVAVVAVAAVVLVLAGMGAFYWRIKYKGGAPVRVGRGSRQGKPSRDEQEELHPTDDTEEPGMPDNEPVTAAKASGGHGKKGKKGWAADSKCAVGAGQELDEVEVNMPPAPAGDDLGPDLEVAAAKKKTGVAKKTKAKKAPPVEPEENWM